MSIPQAIENVRNAFLAKKNVNGLGVGEKWTNGINTHEQAVVVLVSKKEDTAALHPSDVVPSTINGIKTDVIEVGNIVPHTFNGTARVRPIQPGYSVGSLLVTAGTIGAFFKDGDGAIVGLSCNHVVAGVNQDKPGDVIVQPGLYDQSSWSGNVVGNLKHFRPLVGAGQWSFNAADWTGIYGYNVDDSGIFTVANPTSAGYVTAIPGLGEVAGFNDIVTVGQTLQKVGRTTGLSSAAVIATGATVTVNYGGNLNYQFRDQIITNNMSQGGDSGSIVLDQSMNIVGLLFAGSNTITIHNRIRYPRASWGLQIIHSVPLIETLTYTFTVDSVPQANSYTESQFEQALTDARTLAASGHTVAVNVAFTTHE